MTAKKRRTWRRQGRYVSAHYYSLDDKGERDWSINVRHRIDLNYVPGGRHRLSLIERDVFKHTAHADYWSSGRGPAVAKLKEVADAKLTELREKGEAGVADGYDIADGYVEVTHVWDRQVG